METCLHLKNSLIFKVTPREPARDGRFLWLYASSPPIFEQVGEQLCPRDREAVFCTDWLFNDGALGVS